MTCDNKLNREHHRLGEKQGMWIKFCSGVLLFSILIAVIWAPMLVFNLPLSCCVCKNDFFLWFSIGSCEHNLLTSAVLVVVAWTEFSYL